MNTKEQQIRKLQKQIMDERKDLTMGEQRDIVIYINHNTSEYNIEFIQQILETIDEALGHLGFSNSKSTTIDSEGICEVEYWQFGWCGKG